MKRILLTAVKKVTLKTSFLLGFVICDVFPQISQSTLLDVFPSSCTAVKADSVELSQNVKLNKSYLF